MKPVWAGKCSPSCISRVPFWHVALCRGGALLSWDMSLLTLPMAMLPAPDATVPLAPSAPSGSSHTGPPSSPGHSEAVCGLQLILWIPKGICHQELHSSPELRGRMQMGPHQRYGWLHPCHHLFQQGLRHFGTRTSPVTGWPQERAALKAEAVCVHSALAAVSGLFFLSLQHLTVHLIFFQRHFAAFTLRNTYSD